MQNERMHAGAAEPLFQRAAELRNIMTHAEELLWSYLRTKPFNYKFRRQHPFSIYILDFYCHALRQVIEVDGSIHNEADIKENDQVRQMFLERDGLTVVRFTNEEVLYGIQNVIAKLETLIQNKTKPIQ